MRGARDFLGEDASGDVPASSTVELLDRARAGDARALDELFARAGPPLRRWARGRLPRGLRDIADTDDLVQETMLATLKHIDVFEYRTDGALQAYLRQSVLNRIRNEVRRAFRRPASLPVDTDTPDMDESPLDALIGRQSMEAYDTALAQLQDDEREAVIARVELGLSYAEVAQALGRPSPDAARMFVGRVLVKVAALLDASAAFDRPARDR